MEDWLLFMFVWGYCRRLNGVRGRFRSLKFLHAAIRCLSIRACHDMDCGRAGSDLSHFNLVQWMAIKGRIHEHLWIDRLSDWLHQRLSLSLWWFARLRRMVVVLLCFLVGGTTFQLRGPASLLVGFCWRYRRITGD